MYDVLKVPLAFTWEIYGDSSADFSDCFKMFNPVTPDVFKVRYGGRLLGAPGFALLITLPQAAASTPSKYDAVMIGF